MWLTGSSVIGPIRSAAASIQLINFINALFMRETLTGFASIFLSFSPSFWRTTKFRLPKRACVAIIDDDNYLGLQMQPDDQNATSRPSLGGSKLIGFFMIILISTRVVYPRDKQNRRERNLDCEWPE